MFNSNLPLYMDQLLFPGKRENFLLSPKRSQRYSLRRENFPPVNTRKISFDSFTACSAGKIGNIDKGPPNAPFLGSFVPYLLTPHVCEGTASS